MEMTSQQLIAASDTRTGAGAQVWTARILRGMVILFLLFDSITKIIKDPHVIAASADFGLSPNQIAGIGAILLACTVIYIIPRAAFVGALLLTGYLGGAVASNLRAGHGSFQLIFPIIFAVLAWAPLWLQDRRVRELVSSRSSARPD